MAEPANASVRMKEAIFDGFRPEKVAPLSERGAADAPQFTQTGNWELDIQACSFTATDEAYRIFGAEPHSESVQFDRVLSFIHPQDVDRVIDAFSGTGDYRKSRSVDFRIVGMDGVPRMLRGVGRFFFGPDGHPIRAYGTVQDVTERRHVEDVLRESDSKFRVLAETTSSVILILQDEKFVYANPAASRMTGYSASEISSMKFWQVVHPDHRDLVIGRSIARIHNENVPYQYELKYVTKGGEMRWAEINVGVTRYNYRPALIVTAFDITDRKLAEEKTLASLKEKELLLKEIHHRVKNNMQIISSLLNLQSGSLKDQQAVSAFVNSQHRIRSMAIVHEMLYQSDDFSRIHFEGYVRKLANYLFRSYSVDTNRIRLNIAADYACFNIDTAIPCGLIVNELVTNAVKYAFQGRERGVIGIGLRRDNEADRYVLTVSDDGIGIPSGIDICHVDTLGLSLVSTLVRQLRGRMEVERDGGTTFRITF